MGKGSFFGDGKSDILLQNNDGSAALWDMNGTTILGGGLVAPDPGPAWHIEGTAGGLTITPGSGSFTDAAGNIYTLSADGVAEINGSAVPDFGGTKTLEYYDGKIYGQDATTGNWFTFDFSDDSPSGSAAPGFFADGNTGIVLQNNDGSVALWDMSGNTILGGGLVASNPGPTWHVKGTGVFFGDGNTDIVLQNDNGSVALWDMKGTSIIGGGVVSNPGTGWNVLDNIMQFIYSEAANETLAATPTTPDEFVFTSFAAGSHTIGGFNPVQDVIEFSKAQFASFTDVQAATSAISGGAMINLSNGSLLLLPGVDAGSLHASNFVLA
jgi:hypothetical protein